MNRINLLGLTLAAGGIATMTSYSLNDLPSYVGAFGFDFSMFGVITSMCTNFGEETLISYKKTLQHLERTGKLEPDFLSSKMETYCVRQGIYFAAKETGHLEEFNQEVKNHPSIIPNF